jgi:trimethylamine--corrinoid protein Co-methyltransferase
MVRFDPDLVEHALTSVPSSYTVHARNPERNIVMGGNYMNFGTVGGPPYALDIDRGRRPGTLADFTELVKLAHSLNIVHFLAGSAPEAQDVAVPIRHMVMGRVVLTLSDKVPFAGTITPQRMRDFFDMVCIVRGISEEQLLQEPSYYSVINTNSPLQLDGPMAHGVIEMAKFNQPLCITPFTLLGAMAPVTLAGALTQQNAEALAAITLSQWSPRRAASMAASPERGYAQRRPRLRHARVYQGGADRRPDGAALQDALPLLQHQRIELA